MSLSVLVVSNMWPRDTRPGFGAFVAAQVNAIRMEGIQVEVETIEGDLGRSAYLRAIPRINSAVRRLRPDVVHAHFGYTGFSASFHSRPLVVSFCGDDLLGAPGARGVHAIRTALGRKLSQFAARRADGIICKSANLVAALQRPSDRARAHVIPNGVDFQQFSPGDRAAARAALGIDVSRPLVLFPHDPRQRVHKGFALAEQAMALVHRSRPDAELRIVHGRPHRELPAWYRAADCTLLTSLTEGSPNVVKESLACGCPVVGVDAGDAAMWVRRAPPSVVVARDPAAIADGIRAVLASGTRVDPAPLRVELDSRAVARRIVALYEASVRGPSSSS